MNKLKILYYDRIDVSEGINVNKTSKSKERDICHYCYFLNRGFKFQQNVCNRLHDLLMMSMIITDIANLNNKKTNQCCIISEFSKNEAMNLIQNVSLAE